MREKYFSDFSQKKTLARGEVLLNQGDRNGDLFFIESGKIIGTRTEESGSFEILSAGPGEVVGLISFFGQTQSVSTLVAKEDTLLILLPSHLKSQNNPNLYQDFFPSVVSELFHRQLHSVHLQREQEEMQKKIEENEKLALLGRFSAGVAHELNNAVAVFSQGARWLSEKMVQDRADNPDSLTYFTLGLEKGRVYNSQEKRERISALNSLGFSNQESRKLAPIPLEIKKIKDFFNPDDGKINRITADFELGILLKDLQTTSLHCEHVLVSMKNLGGKHQTLEPCGILATLHMALALFKREIDSIRLNIHIPEEFQTLASRGDLVQIWSNLIKNSIEALKNQPQNGDGEPPTLTITGQLVGLFIDLDFTDNGPGIDPKVKETLFLPDVTTKKKGLAFGLGLGLSIVEKIVKSYQGEVFLNPTVQGASFKVRLKNFLPKYKTAG